MADPFETIKAGLRRQAQQSQEAAQRRLQQRFTGRLSSGALSRLESQAGQQAQADLAQQLAGIDVQKNQLEREERLIKEGQQFQSGEAEKQRLFAGEEAGKQRLFSGEEAGKQRTFVTGERLGSQEFAAGQAGEQRKFVTGERLGSQEFAAGEAGRQREFATRERLGSQEFAAGESALSRALQQQQISLAGAQLDEQRRQFNLEYQQNVATNLFNKVVALEDLDIRKVGEIAGILGTDVGTLLGQNPSQSGSIDTQLSAGVNARTNRELDSYFSRFPYGRVPNADDYKKAQAGVPFNQILAARI